MIRKQRYRFQDPNPYTTHHWFAAAIAIGTTAASVGASLYSGSQAAGAAEDAAGLQGQAAQLGINELKAALPPSMQRLAKAQNWSDAHLRRMYRQAMGETRPYADAGRRGLSRLNYLMGTDNGLGPAPTAPKAPKQPKALKPPKYDKDPKKAAAQKAAYDKAVVAQQKAFEKAQRVFGRAQTKYEADNAAWQAATTAQAGDPEFGSMMDPYNDRFEGRIDEVAKREYEDKHGFSQRILDTAAEKYDDKYADEILGVARDKFEADDFEADPGYEFRRSEGNRGIEQSAAAGGSLQSGAALKALTRFNQDTASDEFDRAHGRWADQHNRHLGGLQGQQAADYGFWSDNKGTRLNALSGERAFDYGAWGDQKGTELNTLINQRDFDFTNFDNNRKFQYGSLMDQVGIGQDAADDRNQNRQFYSTARTQNELANATQQGNWQQAMAANIAELLGQKGNAQAAGQVGAANAYSSAFQGAGNTLATMGGYYYGDRNRFGRGGNRRGGGHAGQGLMGDGYYGWNW